MINWTLETVTPEIAAVWLGHNDVNRVLREHRAGFIARSIMDKKWIVTHQAIAFSESGRLLDGQHRLRAIVMANQPVQIWVARNVSEEAFSVMDSGLARQMHERIGTDRRRTSIVTSLFRIVTGQSMPQEYEISLLMDLFDPAMQELETIPKATRSSKVTRAPVMAAAILHLANNAPGSANRRTIYDSLERLISGDLSGASKVIVCLYRQLYEMPNSGGVGAVDMFSRAFYAFDPKNANISKIQIRDASAHIAEARAIFGNLTVGVLGDG